MKQFTILFIATFILLHIQSCKQDTKQLIDINEVSAWCIIGFDSEERSIEERVALVKEMGLKKYGYNRGKAEYDQLPYEFNLAKENNIEITSVFVWLNAKKDSLGHLSEPNETLLTNLKQVSQKPAIWVSFSNNYFEDKDDQESVAVAAEMIKYLKERADDLGCELALYNHTGWFGEPENQIKIIEAIGQDDISIVYNFHHAHDNVETFSETVKVMTPYLSYVNLNGVKKGGPKIMDIGKGDHEYDMINSLIDEGYHGPWGILGHIKTEDAKVVLERNIKGLESLNARYNKAK